MKSFKQMRLDGEIKRGNAEQIEFHNIHVEPGFNPPDRTASDDEEDEALFQFIMNGGFKLLPELEVRPRPDGGVWLVDGHRRRKQIGRAIEAGAPIANKQDGKFWIPICPFEGSDIKRTARIITSGKKKDSSTATFIHVYLRLAGFNLTPEQIAEECNTKLSHVKAHLELANANHDVQAMVSAGVVSTTLAAKVVKDNGEGAGAVLTDALKKSLKAGKSKVTPAAFKQWSPPAKYAAPMVNHVNNLLKTIEPEILARAGSVATFDKADEMVTVTISMRALYMVVQNAEVIAEAKESAEAKARDKVSKAAQEPLPEVAP